MAARFDIAPEVLAGAFRERGFAVAQPLDADFAALVRDAAADADRLAAATDETAHASFQNAAGFFYHVAYPHLRAASFARLIRRPEIAAIVRSLLGDRPVYVTHSKISYKYHEADQAWLPHQDSGYKDEPREGFTICVHLEDVSEANGALQLFPGSHRLGRLPHVRVVRPGDSAPQTAVRDMPAIAPEFVGGPAGSILYFALDTIHQSPPNHVGGNRKILIFEVEPIRLLSNDEHGRPAIVINGRRGALQSALAAAWAVLTAPMRLLRRSRGLVRWFRRRRRSRVRAKA
jgi:ectoine hydroxylase-related dioxygenase (phytanoyl-CoA dioxygenase family)